ncbi:MAG TPA: S41 family peptidase [Bacteroidia bacterium]|jgi:carboxyl-terminal processing protease|nr:S41 family peptidase [Bacteroidia bacterium]
MSTKNILRKTLRAFRRKTNYIFPLLVIFAGFIGFAATDNEDDHLFEISKNMEIFGTVYQQLNKLYVDEPQPGRLMKTGIDAMLNSLDPYTNFYPQEDIEDYRYETTGEYGGIGTSVRMIGDQIVLAEPYEGFPAALAGLKAGDVLLEVDGKVCKGKTYEQIGKLLKGLPNTSVKIKIQRPGENAPQEFTLTRQEIKQKNVTYSALLDNKVGYLRLNEFQANAALEVRQAVMDLKQQGATSIVLDLRENPGGLLTEAVGIVNIFVDKKQLVVSMRGRVKDWDKEFYTEVDPVDTKIPLAVLVNAWSASASEIVAGSLQDLDRAVIVGQRSFGKGLVQQTLPLVYGSMFKVTVAKYYIPSGRCVQSIDYENRKADGTLVRVSDSLITSYKTKNGRIVWNGLGIIPDDELPARKYSVLADTLLAKAIIFNYATTFAKNNASIDKPDKFRLTDAQYDDFVKWAKTQDYTYVIREEQDLVNFKKHAEKNNSFADVTAEYDAMKKKIDKSKEDDFTEFKSEIKVLLEAEISSRYYYASGRVAASLKDDPELLDATKILLDQSKYNSILTTIVKSSKPKQRADLENND